MGSAQRTLTNDRFATAVFYSQECVEYAVKSVLESLGIKYPPIHDISGLLRELRDDQRLPRWFKAEIPELATTVSWLARLRIPARYGDQRAKIPPSRLFRRGEAEKAIDRARYVLKLSQRFVRWWFRKET